MNWRDEVVRLALELDHDDRVWVIEALEHSLHEAPFTTPCFSAAWAAEIERRLAAYERGEITSEEMKLALERLRTQYRQRKPATP